MVASRITLQFRLYHSNILTKDFYKLIASAKKGEISKFCLAFDPFDEECDFKNDKEGCLIDIII